MKLLFPVLLAAVTLVSSTPVMAQSADDATKVTVKMRQLDILNQILPVLMTPQQINKLLPAIEKSRAAAIEEVRT